MNAWSKLALAATMAAAVASAAHANPELFVTYQGSGGGNHEWLVAVAPDPAFFAETTSGFGSSLAVELAFAIEGSTIATGSVIENNVDWPFDNPGNNPFTNNVTFGLWLSGAQDKAFGAFGGKVFLSDAPVRLFSFETVGTDPTTVHYGVAASGHPTKGSIIAQSGQNFPVEFAGFAAGELSLTAADLSGMASGEIEIREFSGYTGSVTSVPELSTAILALVGVPLGLCALGRRRY